MLTFISYSSVVSPLLSLITKQKQTLLIYSLVLLQSHNNPASTVVCSVFPYEHVNVITVRTVKTTLN
jgi:hypothetical protein